jgi:hypothetical protein
VARARGDFPLHLPGGAAIRLPSVAHRLAGTLAAMPSWRGPRAARERAALAPLIEHGIVAARDLPLSIRPAAPRKLDGWRFA